MAFNFKQFIIEDDRSSMKVGTDAVLLGAWATHHKPDNILDIGCGSGILSIMMAQRFQDATIFGIDIHRPSIEQASENFKRTKWQNRLAAIHISLQDHASQTPQRYDLIVSNPPFFTDSLLPPKADKANAKHTRALSYNDIARCVSHLLADKAKFVLILPFLDQPRFDASAKDNGLFKSHEMTIIPVRGKSPNRVLTLWNKQQQALSQDTLTIREADNNYTEAYIQFTKDFYLAL